jgi:hypothetical protein
LLRKLPALLLTISLFIFLSSGVLLAQAPEELWFETYGGEYPDEGESFVETADGGFMIAGYSYVSEARGYDIYVIKTDSFGSPVWQKFYGGEMDDAAGCIQATDDGNFIVAGGTESFEAENSDMFWMKINPDGDVMWQRTIGGHNDEYANYVISTSDGGYLLSGYTNSFGAGFDDIYLVKTESDGFPVWSRTYGDEFFDKGYMVKETDDGNYVLVAGLDYFGHYPVNAYLLKTNPDGDTLWTSILGGTLADACNAFAETPDNGFLLIGWTMSYSVGEQDLFLVKTDSVGQEQWHKSYGGLLRDIGRSIYPTSDGGYIVTGYTLSFGAGSSDVYTIKTDSNGDSIWTATFGGSLWDNALEIREVGDGGYVIVGGTGSFGAGSQDMLLLKYASDQTGFDGEGRYLPERISLDQNYPNPFNETTVIAFSAPSEDVISLMVYDMLGREVAEIANGRLEGTEHRLLFDAGDLASGTYVYRLQAGKDIKTRKMTLLK